MKKTISLTLVLIMLLSSLCSCNGKKPDESDKNIDNNDNNYNQNIEDDNGGENDDGENDDANGQKTDPSKLTYEDQPVAVAKDKHGNCYAYVKQWNAYYLMPSDSAFTDEVVRPDSFPIVHDNVAWLLTFNRLEGELSTYKFFRDNETVEAYNHTCERKDHYDELYGYFYDFYDEDHGYIFFWDEYEALTTGWESTKYLRTDDGGKTWYTPVCETSVRSCCKRDKPIFAKFISENIAVISYKNSEQHHGFCGNIGITTDGGRNWKEISNNFPFPESLLTKEWIRSEIIDFEYINNEYLAYARVYGQNGVVVDVTFSSTDLESWKYVKETNISEIIEAYKLILKDNTYIHLPSYNGIALADLDQDGIAEIVLRASDEFIILHYFEGQAYPHSLSRRVGITKGGTCRWSIQAGRERGMDRIQFNGKKLVYVDETRITQNAEYYLNGVPTTREKIQSIAWCNEPIRFSEFNKDNVELLITADGITNKSLVCNCNNSNDDNHNQNIDDKGDENTENDSIDLAEIVEDYKTAIKGGYMYKYMASCGAFGLVDFDGDGVLEVALESDSYFDNYAMYVLHCSPGKYQLISAGGYYIYKDGSVAWNAQSGVIYGQRELKSWKTNEFNELWRIENDGKENARYYINNLPVSEEEIKYHLDNACNEKIEWYEFTEENIEKYITVENFSDTSHFCCCDDN